MPLFSRKDDLEKEAVRASKEAISSIIAKEMQITGEIRFKGKARIDGTVDGNISGEYLVLSESGRVNGDLVLDALVCHGTVEGNIQAKLVTAHATAVIRGRLESANLTVESGATLEGEIKAMKKQQHAAEKAKSAGTAVSEAPSSRGGNTGS
ncbi:bactofilin family protein [Desulfolithobacter sp.]